MEIPTYDPFPRPGNPDFTSFPRHLLEDVVSYSVHLPCSADLTGVDNIRNRLREILKASKELGRSLLHNHIWQREGFALSLSVGAKHPYLHGKTQYGDSIADEWLVVYLLREISKRFGDAWIRVSDADGEFLLIEAASVLPKWLKPEIAENRVWINGGHLRIVPRDMVHGSSRVASTASDHVTEEAVLAWISKEPASLLHLPKLEEEAFYRLRNYPEQIKESMHTTNVLIPRNLAFVLHHVPAHISAAVDAFYLRDPISLRPLQPKSTLPLCFPPDDLVCVSAIFTRVSYAQLKSQEFATPAKWQEAIRSTMKPAVQSRVDTGMRTCCGFEMLMADPQNQDKRSVREIKLLLDDIESGEERLPTDAEISAWPKREDSEKWLDVHFEDFERELAVRNSTETISEVPGHFGDRGAQDNLRKIVERFEQFLKDDDAESGDVSTEDDVDDDNEGDSQSADSNSPGPAEQDFETVNEDQLEFAMRQMMGLPEAQADKKTTTDTTPASTKIERHKETVQRENLKLVEVDSSEDDGIKDADERDITELSQRMEAELRSLGALNLQSSDHATKSIGSANDASSQGDAYYDDEQYTLARNLLEAFKSQGGASGPAGNLMKALGLSMPRDEGDSD